MDIHTIEEPAPFGRLKWISILSALFAVFLLAVYLSAWLLTKQTVYHGVFFQGQPVDGYTREQLSQTIQQKISKNLDSQVILFAHDSYLKEIKLSSFNLFADIEATVDQAYMPGHSGNIYERFFSIWQLGRHPIDVGFKVSVDDAKVSQMVDEIYREAQMQPTQAVLELKGSEVILNPAIPGYRPDKEMLTKAILNQLGMFSGGIINIPMDVIPAPSINGDSFYGQIVQEPVNAEIEKVNSRETGIKPHTVGRSIDRQELDKVIRQVEANQTAAAVKLPVKQIYPEVTQEMLAKKLFKDRLSACKTLFSQQTQIEKNRSDNIRLAAEAVNGIILMPGEEFSFNYIVGERTKAKGYQIAHVFYEGKVAAGIGGGICQVSSTLYKAVMESNLKVTERHPHTFMISYLPPGQDATIAYGSKDLKFINNRDWPIQIKALVDDDGSLTVDIYGTNLKPDIEYQLTSTVVSETPVQTVYQEDSTLLPGQQTLLQSGIAGAVADSYLLEVEKGTVTGSNKIDRSHYTMLPQIISTGQKK